LVVAIERNIIAQTVGERAGIVGACIIIAAENRVVEALAALAAVGSAQVAIVAIFLREHADTAYAAFHGAGIGVNTDHPEVIANAAIAGIDSARVAVIAVLENVLAVSVHAEIIRAGNAVVALPGNERAV
jgi:hypothetical protein